MSALASWWWPTAASAKNGFSIDRFVEALSVVGFEPCIDCDWQEEYEKIAIYADEESREFKHVCLLIAPGRWRSKWGRLSDFSHDLNALNSGHFGKLFRYMKRQRALVTVDATIAMYRQ